MRKDLLRGVAAVLAFTVLLGLAYPLVVTGIGQALWPTKADGDPTLIAVRPEGEASFFPRPSATDDAPDATFFSNRGPNQSSARSFYRDQLKAYIDREGRDDPGLVAADVPQDAVTTSASGVDPHISPANAAIQAHRVAARRGLPLAEVRRLIEEHTDGRALGVFGEPGVNVVTLNRSLDAPRP